MRLVSLLIIVWLVIGAIAVFQRGYFNSDSNNCASIGTIALTVVVGPLNYAGVNPVVADCNLPQPSQ